MAKQRAVIETAVGDLISAIQKEWVEEAGAPEAALSEDAMDRAHELLQQAKDGTIKHAVKGEGVAAFLGDQWVSAHPSVWPFIREVEAALDGVTMGPSHPHMR